MDLMKSLMISPRYVHHSAYSYCRRWLSSSKNLDHAAKSSGLNVLGIETSCDDTAAAVVNMEKEILGESLFNQGHVHRELGGIIPTLARDLHKENIERVAMEALERSGISQQELDAVAVTVRPGLPLSLLVGLEFAKRFAIDTKPLIPIHHMEAHALTARLTNNVKFPYLVFLMSGGHCLLAVVENVNQFKLLGSGIDCSPGDMLDKTARRLRLKSILELEGIPGGAAIERLASQGDPNRFDFPSIMSNSRNCDFSFSGLQFLAKKYIEIEEERLGVRAGVIPTAADLCAALQHAVLSHMAKRLYRAFLFCEAKELLPSEGRNLVLSGGVASNMFIRDGLGRVAKMFDCGLVCPPPHLCTDNGVMIAWNGVEKMKAGIDVLSANDDIKVEHRSPLGTSMAKELHSLGLKVPSGRKILKYAAAT